MKNQNEQGSLQLAKIPEIPKSDGWKEVQIIECNEALVSLNDKDSEHVVVVPKYFEQGLPNASPVIYAREGIANKLVEAAKLLPNGYKLVIWDAWRPLEVQQSLFDEYKDRLRLSNSEKSDDELTILTQTYVSLPSNNPLHPSPHYTGGAVDLSIIDDFGNPLEMGTPFDHFGIEASATYYEHVDQQADEIINNRRLLYSVMTAVGFSPYDEEWWHYDLGNQFDAKRTGKAYAIYGPVELNSLTQNLSN